MRPTREDDSSLSRRRLLHTTVAAAGSAVATSSAVAARPGSSAPARVVDVRRFGATGNGTTNDGPAINRAIQALREQVTSVGRYPTAPKLVFPAGVYAVDETLNLTRLQAINAFIDGDSSIILGRCAGLPVIDALGARFLTIANLTVIGDAKLTPKVGVQIGRLADRLPADCHQFDNVKLVGNYTLAAMVNSASESVGFNHVFFWNDHPDRQSYCLVQDGLSHFGTTTSFLANQHVVAGHDASFNENEFVNCDFRHAGGGIPIWLGDTTRHRFYGCYAAGSGDAAFVVYSGPNGNTMLDIDCHCETKGLQNVFVFTGASRSTVVHGFSYKDHAPTASRAVFARAAPLESVNIEHAAIEISGFAEPTCRVLDDPSVWSITGRYYSPDPGPWNADKAFSGILSLDKTVQFPRADTTSISPTPGSAR